VGASISPKLVGPATLAIAAMAACALVAGCGSGGAGAAGQVSSTATSSIAAQASSTPSAPNAPSTGLTAEQVAHRMKLRHVTAYTAATDPNHLLGRQGGYTSKINWSNGSIEVFSTPAEAQKRKTYLLAFAGTPLGDGYDYLAGTYLLRIFDSQTPTQAHALEAKFLKITK
jgi:hypothetical protein